MTLKTHEVRGQLAAGERQTSTLGGRSECYVKMLNGWAGDTRFGGPDRVHEGPVMPHPASLCIVYDAAPVNYNGWVETEGSNHCRTRFRLLTAPLELVSSANLAVLTACAQPRSASAAAAVLVYVVMAKEREPPAWHSMLYETSYHGHVATLPAAGAPPSRPQ